MPVPFSYNRNVTSEESRGPKLKSTRKVGNMLKTRRETEKRKCKHLHQAAKNRGKTQKCQPLVCFPVYAMHKKTLLTIINLIKICCAGEKLLGEKRPFGETRKQPHMPLLYYVRDCATPYLCPALKVLGTNLIRNTVRNIGECSTDVTTALASLLPAY